MSDAPPPTGPARSPGSPDRPTTADAATPPDPPPTGSTPELGDWNRLHPATVLSDVVRSLPQVAIGVALILSSSGQAGFELIQLGFGVFALFPVVIRYATGRYRVGPDQVQWRMGLLRRSAVDLPRSRIQSVDTRVDLVGRLLGLETVTVSSAGGDAEIAIGLIDRPAGHWLRQELAPDVGAAPPPGTVGDAPEIGPAPVTLAELDRSHLPTVLAVSTPTVLGVVLLVLFWSVLAFLVVTGRIGFFALFFFLPSLLSIPALITGVLDQAIGFRSVLAGDRLRVGRGIVSRQTLEAPLRRVQGLTVTRTFFARRLGRERIAVDTADVSGAGASQQLLLHPIAPDDTWRAWAPDLLGHDAPDPTLERRVARVSIRRRLVAVSREVLVLILTAVPAVWAVDRWLERGRLAVVVAVTVVIAAAVIGTIVAIAAYRIERWVLDDDVVAFRSGVLTRTEVVVPRRRTQGVVIRSNWFQRRLGVADLAVDTASPTVSGEGRDLHTADALALADDLLASADESGGV